jgi:hypothetical protein
MASPFPTPIKKPKWVYEENRIIVSIHILFLRLYLWTFVHRVFYYKPSHNRIIPPLGQKIHPRISIAVIPELADIEIGIREGSQPSQSVIAIICLTAKVVGHLGSPSSAIIINRQYISQDGTLGYHFVFVVKETFSDSSI